MVLTIPSAGLHLELPSSNSSTALPTQAFAITLNNSVIEDLIDCVQNGQDIKLCLGNNPTFLYGSNTHKIQRSADSSPYDLFLTDPTDDSKRATKLPGPAMSLFRKPDMNRMPWLKQKSRPVEQTSKKSKAPASPAQAPSRKTGLEADIEALENSFAQHEAEKLENSAQVIATSKNGGIKLGKKLLPVAKGARGTPSSLPSSPALTGLGSASPSQQLLDKAKQVRSPIIHELAFRDQTYDNLWNKYPGGTEAEFRIALEKVADLVKETQNYVLRAKFWRELDVFNHEYASDEERQAAIDNAVRAYDRQRISSSDKVWQLLLPENERGKGKCLSKLVKLAQGPTVTAAAPMIKLSRADESGPESGSSNDRTGGEPMSRSSSQTKTKKPTAREIQEKRLLGGGSKKASTPKASTPKVSPTKSAASERPGTTKSITANSKYKSAEYVINSDSDASDSSAPLANSKMVKKPAPKPAAERLPSKPVAKESPAPAPKPKPRPAVKRDEPVRKEEVIKAQITAKPVPRKRPREDDDSSSSSGTPLIKRHKPKEITGFVSKPAASTLKRRSPDSGSTASLTKENLNANRKAHISRDDYRPPKSTSPTKSSPLASSPPTNASDLDPAEENAHISTKSTKRKLGGGDGEYSSAKRQRPSQDVVRKAMKFRKFYEAYEALHKELMQMEHPPESRVVDLLDMRARLDQMKQEIKREAGA